MIALHARELEGGYGAHRVVGPVDVTLAAGSCLAVVGPNGSGKSTLLRLLAGILPAGSGTITLLGRPLTSWSRRQVARQVGFVPQSVTLAFSLTVEEMVMQGRAPHLGAWRSPGRDDVAAVDAALAEVGLSERRGSAVPTMSGGERQLVLLARALAAQPRLLLLDEPATGLDVRHQLALAATVRRLVEAGVGAAVVLHDWNLALRLADTAVVLHHGRLAASGAAAEVLQPAVLEPVFGVTVHLVETPEQALLVPSSLCPGDRPAGVFG